MRHLKFAFYYPQKKTFQANNLFSVQTTIPDFLVNNVESSRLNELN